MEQAKKYSCDIIVLIRLLLYTGCRLSEIQYAKWEGVDFDRGLLLLPDSKVGQRSVALSPPALDLLRALPYRGSEWIIRGSVAKENSEAPTSIKQPQAPLKALHKMWYDICRRANIEDVRLHDLRHTVGLSRQPTLAANKRRFI